MSHSRLLNLFELFYLFNNLLQSKEVFKKSVASDSILEIYYSLYLIRFLTP